MRKIVVTEFVSLDGVMENPGWTVPYGSDAIEKFKLDELFASDCLLLGRVTCQAFASAWPNMKDEQGFADRMNSLPKHVATTTLKEMTWNAKPIQGGLVEAISTLKQQPGMDILVGGSCTLVQTLIQHDLVDQYNLLVYPVVLGSGKRLFGDGAKAKLNLVETKKFDTGVTLLVYQPDRKIRP